MKETLYIKRAVIELSDGTRIEVWAGKDDVCITKPYELIGHFLPMKTFRKLLTKTENKNDND